MWKNLPSRHLLTLKWLIELMHLKTFLYVYVCVCVHACMTGVVTLPVLPGDCDM